MRRELAPTWAVPAANADRAHGKYRPSGQSLQQPRAEIAARHRRGEVDLLVGGMGALAVVKGENWHGTLFLDNRAAQKPRKSIG